ncbi:DUF948 domain-containing protein [Euhalothece natronophila Z-M001]|uniref:DUF948 domain-containing protein n=1 Tax=Euhalothece natronophila Z-M001 TaxID=522448 RepID=A0A5B8NSR7_9CHRO|nr:DUF948 domain-containing protein [Euhalothece natronophila]QDZ41551.1 DUF948 domain-containing protein [Euhalothece natronophila Z-M001]
MSSPLFWLALSLFLVSVSLTAVLMAAFPAFLELARAARNADKFIDTLHQELPSTLKAIRLTGEEITELTNDVNTGVKSASKTVQQFDQGVTTAKHQAKGVKKQTQGVITGLKVAWKTWQGNQR